MVDATPRRGRYETARNGSVPVINVTGTLHGMYERVEQLRTHADRVLADAADTARQLRETAEQLEQIAGTLDGSLP